MLTVRNGIVHKLLFGIQISDNVATGSGDSANQTETLVTPDIVFLSTRASKCICNYSNCIT